MGAISHMGSISRAYCLLSAWIRGMQAVSMAYMSLAEVPDKWRLSDDTVELNYNSIMRIHSKAFPREVYQVDISNNQLVFISPWAFSESSYLSKLNAANNNLTCVPDLQAVSASLQTLNLANNRIGSGCGLNSNVQAFQVLGHLDLRNNYLLAVPQIALLVGRWFEELHLAGNCFVCDKHKAFDESSKKLRSHNAHKAACTKQKSETKRCLLQGLQYLITRVAPDPNLTWSRDDWLITGSPDLVARDNSTISGTSAPGEEENIGSEVAFMTCIMIFVCTTCLGSVLYLGQKSRMSDASSEKFESEFYSEYGDSQYAYSSGSGSSNSSRSGSRYNSYDSYDSYNSSRRGSSGRQDRRYAY